MLPAGEMWSVVTLSPSLASTRAPTTSVTGAAVMVSPSRNGGAEDVAGVLVPFEGVAGGRRHRLPPLVTVEHRAHTAGGTSPR